MDKFTHLWNDMPADERKRLVPYQFESQINDLLMTRTMIVRGHKRTLKELDERIKNLTTIMNKAANHD